MTDLRLELALVNSLTRIGGQALGAIEIEGLMDSIMGDVAKYLNVEHALMVIPCRAEGNDILVSSFRLDPNIIGDLKSKAASVLKAEGRHLGGLVDGLREDLLDRIGAPGFLRQSDMDISVHGFPSGFLTVWRKGHRALTKGQIRYLGQALELLRIAIERRAGEEALAKHAAELARGHADLERKLKEQATKSPKNPTIVPDFFISHASEDKEAIATPLATELQRRGYDVWYDEFVLRMGDRLTEQIDRGLRFARFGIVILSPHFFRKQWPQAELDALVNREIGVGRKLILPVLHDMSIEELSARSQLLASKLCVSSRGGMMHVAEEVEKAVASQPL